MDRNAYDHDWRTHGNRYYDPEVGRYLTRDPISYASGTLNVYAYVGNSPISRIDPVGLFWKRSIEKIKAAWSEAVNYYKEGYARVERTRAVAEGRADPKDNPGAMYVRTMFPKAYESTGVQVVRGYEAGSAIWRPEIVSAHTYITVDGDAYGFYSDSHVHGGPSKDDFGGPGLVTKDDDLVYPVRPADEAAADIHRNYAEAYEVKVDPRYIDAEAFRDSVRAFGENEYEGYRRDPTSMKPYSIQSHNCSDWTRRALDSALHDQNASTEHVLVKRSSNPERNVEDE